jgi:3-oxoadipate enol-lactonase
MNDMETMVKVDGGTVWADDTGGPGAPVVLVHPGVGTHGSGSRSCPGCGPATGSSATTRAGTASRPPATAPYTLLTDLVAVLDQLDVPPAVFVGCSQGGTSSIDLALSQPSAIRTIRR